MHFGYYFYSSFCTSIHYLFNHQIPAFKYPAKVSHSKYGIFRYAAHLLIIANFRIIKNTNIHSRTNHRNENKYQRKLKKNDLLVCEGGDIGRAAIWDKDYEIRFQKFAIDIM